MKRVAGVILLVVLLVAGAVVVGTAGTVLSTFAMSAMGGTDLLLQHERALLSVAEATSIAGGESLGEVVVATQMQMLGSAYAERHIVGDGWEADHRALYWPDSEPRATPEQRFTADTQESVVKTLVKHLPAASIELEDPSPDRRVIRFLLGDELSGLVVWQADDARASIVWVVNLHSPLPADAYERLGIIATRGMEAWPQAATP